MQTSLGVYAVLHNGYWKEFDYRDWRTIGPIAQKYDAFPFAYRHKRSDPIDVWTVSINGNTYTAETTQKVIALAVIEEIGGFKIP